MKIQGSVVLCSSHEVSASVIHLINVKFSIHSWKMSDKDSSVWKLSSGFIRACLGKLFNQKHRETLGWGYFPHRNARLGLLGLYAPDMMKKHFVSMIYWETAQLSVCLFLIQSYRKAFEDLYGNCIILLWLFFLPW